MRKIYIITLALIILSATTLYADEPYNLPDEISRVHNQIRIAVIPQVELISIVQLISSYPTVFDFLMVQDTSQYKNDVLEYFKPYKDHPIIKMFDRLSLQPRMLNFSAPSNVMLYTDNSLQLRTDILPDEFVLSRTGGLDSLIVFITLLKDFANVSSFNNFYIAHKNYYEKIIENTIRTIGGTDYITELETFYGVQQQSYTINLVSLYGHVGFGNSLLLSDNKREIYNTMGPQRIENNIPVFGDERYLKYIIRHEFSHPFVNPLTEKYWEYIKDYSCRFDEIPDVARREICGEWEECINEFIIRAITVHLAYLESEDAGIREYEYETSRGVSSLDPLLKIFREYAANRSEYPTLESYYTTILDVFKN